MGAEENVLTSVNDERDDLETIKGIGPTTADALYRIGVRRLADLAQYTPHTLAEALNEQAGLEVSPKRIETSDWIGQARTLAQQAKAKRRLPEKEDLAP